MILLPGRVTATINVRRQILLINILRGELLEEARPQELFVPVPGDVKGGSYSPFEVL